ncbi:glycosyltransferase family 2 protein [Gilliamella sp. Pas-s25]|uniref:glycosyltransferase family 2 protein n=1 Tax=Gilliamella sp. Pas-s25 TaxID=2687310 RepID=UPI00135D8566|nr:glycosyltransferase family 2 protein [Gilliamella sp. Pas-s25]MWP62865.1 glycosyltransferase [Gilliamella sp. Pas-s25]
MINKNTSVSVIIPCYNVRDYITDCLDSLINQYCLPKEIICIDDGSTDDTLLILQKYASKWDYIKIIEQTNQGVSTARNQGFEIAKGDYILFIDSDDILNINLLYQFDLFLKRSPNLDLFYFDYSIFKQCEKSPKQNEIKAFETEIFKSGTDLLTYLLERKNYSGVVWRFIFKRQLLTEKFIQKNHEDHLISLSIISKAKLSHYFKNRTAYFHRIRSTSLSNLNVDYIYVGILKNVLTECIKQITSLPLSDMAKRNYILVMNVTYLESILKSSKLNKKEEKDNLIKELGILRLLIRIYSSNKPNIIRNIFYTLKFMKKYECSMSTKKALLKCAITKQHPCLDIRSNYNQYSSLNNF